MTMTYGKPQVNLHAYNFLSELAMAEDSRQLKSIMLGELNLLAEKRLLYNPKFND